MKRDVSCFLHQKVFYTRELKNLLLTLLGHQSQRSGSPREIERPKWFSHDPGYPLFPEAIVHVNDLLGYIGASSSSKKFR